MNEPEKPKIVVRFVALVKLLFSTNLFVKAEQKHQHPPGETVEAPARFDHADYSGRTAKKRRGFLYAAIWVTFFLGSGILTAQILNYYCSFSIDTVRIIRVISIAIASWAVWSRLGYETDTFEGITLLEITSEFSFKFFYGVALFLVGIVLFLEPGH